MEIKKELVDDLNAVVTVSVASEDYKSKVETALRSHQKQAQLPGFRSGKVPFSLIKKKYGVAVKVEEINKILSESVQEYITKEELQILGAPMPREVEGINWESEENYEFTYDLGLAPEFELKMSKRNKFTKYNVVPDQEMVDAQVKEICSRFGSVTNPEAIDVEDLFSVTVTGEFADEAVENATTISASRLTEESLKLFTGKKVGDAVEAKLEDIYESNSEKASLVGKQEGDAENFEGAFTFTVDSISRMVPAEVNEDLFAKVFPEDEIKSEEDFMTKVKESAGGYLSGEGVRKFKGDLIDSLIEKTTMELPKEFLKKWIQQNSEKPVTLEQIEADFENYEKGLKWQLIESKIVKDNDIKVEFEDIKAKALELINANMAQYGQPALDGEQAEEAIKSVLTNQEEARRINDMLYEDKVVEVIEAAVKIEEEDISYNDFLKLVTDKK